MAFQFMQFLPMLMQMMGSQGGGQYPGGGGGGLGIAGGQGGQKPGDMAAQANPVMGALKGILGAGLKTPPPPIGTDGSAGASVNYGGPQQAPAYQPPAQQDQPGLRNIFGNGQPQQLGYGGGMQRGPLEGLSGPGPMPTEASNFARVFPGAALNMGAGGMMGAPQGGGQQGGLLGMLSLLRGFGGGMR